MINSNSLFKELGLPESPVVNENHRGGDYYEDYEQDPSLGFAKKVILELTVNLTPEYSSTIKLLQGDRPEEVAEAFGRRHNLTSEAIRVIVEHIKNHFPSPSEERLAISQRQGKENTQKQQSDIFDRLHKEAVKKKQRQQDREMKEERRTNSQLPTKSTSKSSLTANPSNLYSKGLRQRQERELGFQISFKLKRKATEEKRLQLQEEQMREYTFKPKVSSKSMKIIGRKGGSVPSSSIEEKRSKTPNAKHEDQLILQGQQKKERQRTASFLKNTTPEATFKPSVNEMLKLKWGGGPSFNRSTRIIQEKNKRSHTLILQDKCEQLYSMAKEMQAKKAEHQKEEDLSFRPRVNRAKSDRQYVPFLERVERTLKIRNERQRVEEQNQMVDQVSGQQLYRPKICRPPKIERNRGGLPVWDYLFQNQRKDDSTIHFANDQLDESRDWQNRSIIERSDILVMNMRRQRLEELFFVMDSDKDGFISAEACNLEDLPVDALELLQPVLLQMEQLGVSMNMDIWVDKALTLSSNLSVVDKNRLYQKKRSRGDVQVELFNPKINQKSQRIASQKRNYTGGEGLYEHYHQELYSKEMKRQQIVKSQLEKERAQCTFQPRINTSFK